jgi:O-acetyl-ADP-ribose deacetylase (regulator of RNase III)
MIQFTTGDILKSEADCLINTVNCEGYMGKGIAYQFKLRFPENNKDYVNSCNKGTLDIGKLHYFVEDGKTIINFPTKDKWREKSKIDYIKKGLDELVKLISNLNVRVIAMPPLGCGNGGLNWNDVKGLIEEKLDYIKEEYDFIIYEPSTTYKQVSIVAPQLSISSLVLMKIKMNSISFNSLRLQKTAFFTNFYLGEEYFKFDKYKFGPYAHSIDIISRSIREYQNFYNLKSTIDTYAMVYKVLCSDKTTKTLDKLQPAIGKAANYVNNIKNDKTLEGVSTVLYLMQKNNNNSSESIVKKFKDWSEDKANRFSTKEIEGYINYLEDTGIINKNIVGLYEVSSYNNENAIQIK